ncbi:hypothetical protein Y1Q_0021704 [Alligator mississippiensis]|uniref:Uncharacterized protein n=1 Tax=Alligator mississippiensis TaxID=8496 RepID=A0A151PAM4_ALLMI|nr:hypothetical protein Y1Q_0021704 [Alligator mississippiensis]
MKRRASLGCGEPECQRGAEPDCAAEDQGGQGGQITTRPRPNNVDTICEAWGMVKAEGKVFPTFGLKKGVLKKIIFSLLVIMQTIIHCDINTICHFGT